MQSVGLLMFRSAFVAALVASSWCVGCVSNDEPDDKGAAGTGNTPAGGSSAAGSSSGGSSASGSSAGGSGGAGGSGTPANACATEAKASGTSPVIADFEAMTAATGTYTFESAALLGGTYIYSDLLAEEEPSTTKLLFEAGHSAESTQALVGQIHNATWGGGMGLWFACLDASTYTGLTFWAKGSSPGGPVSVLLTVNDVELESKGGECPDAGPCTRPSVTLDLTEEWKQYTFAWSDFTGGDAAGTPVPGSGDNLYGLEFAFVNDNMSNDITLSLDDVAFTTE